MGRIIRFIKLGAISERNTATAREIGVAINKVTPVRTNVPIIIAAAPKCCSSGVQFVEKKKVERGTSLKTRTPVFPTNIL